MNTLAQIGGGTKPVPTRVVSENADNASAPQTNFQPHLLTGAGSFLNCPFGLHRLLTQPLRNFGQLSLVGTDRGQVLQLANQI